MATTKAYGYLRTSSATNVQKDSGDYKDSDKRQRENILAYAEQHDTEIVGWYYDADVRGADPIDTRPQFATMLEAILGNGVRTIVVDTANRFSRDLITQEIGWSKLKAMGIDLIAADKPDMFLDDTPTAVLVRQILGAVAQFDKATTVAKLKGARDRKKKATGMKVEGKKNYMETVPATVERAKQLHAEGQTLRAIAAVLAEEGMLSEKGNTYSPTSIKNMLAYKTADAAPEQAATTNEPWYSKWDTLVVAHKDMVGDEINDWLRPRGLQSSGTYWEEDLGDATRFWFEDPTTAVHFKLRFG